MLWCHNQRFLANVVQVLFKDCLKVQTSAVFHFPAFIIWSLPFLSELGFHLLRDNILEWYFSDIMMVRPCLIFDFWTHRIKISIKSGKSPDEVCRSKFNLSQIPRNFYTTGSRNSRVQNLEISRRCTIEIFWRWNKLKSPDPASKNHKKISSWRRWKGLRTS